MSCVRDERRSGSAASAARAGDLAATAPARLAAASIAARIAARRTSVALLYSIAAVGPSPGRPASDCAQRPSSRLSIVAATRAAALERRRGGGSGRVLATSASAVFASAASCSTSAAIALELRGRGVESGVEGRVAGVGQLGAGGAAGRVPG